MSSYYSNPGGMEQQRQMQVNYGNGMQFADAAFYERQQYERDNPAVWKRGFETSICGCCSKPLQCLAGCFLPCCFFGKTMSLLGKNCFCQGCLFCMCPVIVGAAGRYSIRQELLIKGNCCLDLLTAIFCLPCALIQERKEVEDVGPMRGDKEINSAWVQS